MKWSIHRKRKQQQHQNCSSTSSFFKLFPISWISKFRHTKSDKKSSLPPDHHLTSPEFFDYAPRRHSCATADEFRSFDRSRRGDLLTSSRFAPDFPLLTCRSCRLDSFSLAPERMKDTKTRRLESFAVVKRSTDPQRDFRESMVEMIEKNGMGKAEELERLLACYLALNAEEYHGVIVKVFKQVWLDLDIEIAHCSRRRGSP